MRLIPALIVVWCMGFVPAVVEKMYWPEPLAERRKSRSSATPSDIGRMCSTAFCRLPGSVIDASSGGNATRHLNHSCAPNCVAYEEQGARGRTIIAFYALRAIQAGEELFLDYSLEVDEAQAPEAFACACGAVACRGTMLAAA
jgi:uncharacterized protein